MTGLTLGFQTRIVRIGNSKGVRIPKALLEEADLSDRVELEVEKGSIVIRPVRGIRLGWADAIEEAPPLDEDFFDAPNDFDTDEWTWE